jgi:hypothetical protein
MKQEFLVMITSSQISLVMRLACTFNQFSMGLLLGLTFSHFACSVCTCSGLLTFVQMFVQDQLVLKGGYHKLAIKSSIISKK